MPEQPKGDTPPQERETANEKREKVYKEATRKLKLLNEILSSLTQAPPAVAETGRHLTSAKVYLDEKDYEDRITSQLNLALQDSEKIIKEWENKVEPLRAWQEKVRELIGSLSLPR